MKHRFEGIIGLRNAADIHARGELRLRRRLRLLSGMLIVLALFAVSRIDT